MHSYLEAGGTIISFEKQSQGFVSIIVCTLVYLSSENGRLNWLNQFKLSIWSFFKIFLNVELMVLNLSNILHDDSR